MDWGIKNKGFTLIEMLVVLAIIAIVITLSTPLSNIYKSNRVSTQVQEFVSTLNVARNEAVSRGAPVSVCARTVNDEGVVICAAAVSNAQNWANGWMVFTDADGDCAVDAGDGDTIINQRNAMASGFSLGFDAIPCIQYTAAGITPDTNGLWTLCDPSANVGFKRGINISVSGRVQIMDSQRADELDIDLADCPA